jgi:uncharacterized membrane protein YsdA (DUF1294 family)
MIRHLIHELQQTDPLHVVLYLICINALTFLIYRYDKRAAIERRWRVSESTLHTLMFIGGTVGAFAAQRILRHKNRKQSFQVTFWLLVMVQVGLVVYATFIGKI